MRPESIGPDPRRVTSLAELVEELDVLRCRAARGSGKKRLSLSALGQLAGLPRSTVHTYISGKVLPAADVLDRMVLALGATGNELAEWAEAWFRLATGARTRLVAEPVPRQLPFGAPDFVGRHTEFADLDRLLTGDRGAGSRSVVITGPSGVGKTALAVRWAHRTADHFPDGQLYLDLRGHRAAEALAPETALERILRALGAPVDGMPADVDERASLFRTLIAGRRMSLVLDNAGSADQVRGLLPGLSACAVLITSRYTFSELVIREGVRRITVTALPLADAVELLNRLLDGDSATTNLQAVAELAQACGRIPVILRTAAECLQLTPALLTKLKPFRAPIEPARLG